MRKENVPGMDDIQKMEAKSAQKKTEVSFLTYSSSSLRRQQKMEGQKKKQYVYNTLSFKPAVKPSLSFKESRCFLTGYNTEANLTYIHTCTCTCTHI